jgi:phosphatidylserine/phosphatidylglycerophosphate/cardiolipin synthase-like enzyme
VKSEIISLINSASKSLYAAVYDINDSDIVSILLSAHKKGIDVKVVMDDVQAETEKDIVSPLNSVGILKTDNSKSALMHNKFLVIDGSKVLTGSTNWTENCLFYNNNNSLLFVSDKLAADYTTEFNEMWNGKFGSSSPANTPYPHVTVGTTDIQCYFAPEDNVEDHIVSEISNAKSYIDFATFTFTSVPISNEIMQKMQEGVKVRGIYETRQASQYCTYDTLKTAGANVIYDSNPKTMHDKFFVIDGQTVITGSYNPTKQANTENDENLLIIKDSLIAQTYEGEFNNLFSMWSNSSTSDSFIIILNPDNPYMTVNGLKQEIDPGRGTTPVIKNSRTLVPIRAIVEVLGGSVDWNDTEKMVAVTLKDTTIRLWINKPQAQVGAPLLILKWIDESNHKVVPEIINGRTMVPLRFVTENLGATVLWNGDTQTITITYQGE